MVFRLQKSFPYSLITFKLSTGNQFKLLNPSNWNPVRVCLSEKNTRRIKPKIFPQFMRHSAMSIFSNSLEHCSAVLYAIKWFRYIFLKHDRSGNNAQCTCDACKIMQSLLPNMNYMNVSTVRCNNSLERLTCGKRCFKVRLGASRTLPKSPRNPTERRLWIYRYHKCCPSEIVVTSKTLRSSAGFPTTTANGCRVIGSTLAFRRKK